MVKKVHAAAVERSTSTTTLSSGTSTSMGSLPTTSTSTETTAASTLSRSSSKSNEDNHEDLNSLYEQFCASSTIHGTYLVKRSQSMAVKLAMCCVFLVVLGMASWSIKSSVKGWEDHPVTTSVMQKSIEDISFPSVTICPLDDTRFGFIEQRLNELDPNDIDVESIVVEILTSLHKNEPLVGQEDCLMETCSKLIEIPLEEAVQMRKRRSLNDSLQDDKMECPTSCPLSGRFKDFFFDIMSQLHAGNDSILSYHSYAWERVRSLLRMGNARMKSKSYRMKRSQTFNKMSCRDNEQHLNCSQVIRDFRFAQRFESLVNPRDMIQSVRPGTLLKLLFSILDGDSAKQNELLFQYLHKMDNQDLFKFYINEKDNISILDLIDSLNGKRMEYHTDRKQLIMLLRELRHSPKLLQLMRYSLHPPHVVEHDFDSKKNNNGGQRKSSRKVIPNAAFPFCWYNGVHDHGIRVDEYNETFCQSFQTTFNELGLCYTYNNVNLGLEGDLRGNSSPDHDEDLGFKVRQVTGCGKQKGLQLILDNQRLASLYPKHHVHRGFKIFITLPGVVTSKVPFTIDPRFFGEHSFFVHGIHAIKTSEAFQEWNKQHKACHFPKDKNLTYFSHYTQDNCLLECRLKKVAAACGCAPWFLKQSELEICDFWGLMCIEQRRHLAHENEDSCNCLADCEMTHFFTSLQRESFSEHPEMLPEFWLDGKKNKGRLFTYLMDPKNFFTDELSRNLTKLAYNLSSDIEFAEKRFREDIAILNIFFDTQIITQIQMELRTNTYDQISAVGGTIGLFTGFSVITLAEVLYWFGCFFREFFKGCLNRAWWKRKESYLKNNIEEEATKGNHKLSLSENNFKFDIE